MYKHILVVVMLCGLVSSFPNPNQDSLKNKISNEKQESQSLFSYFVSLVDTDEDEPPRKKRLQYMSNPFSWLYPATTSQPSHYLGIIRRDWFRWPTRSQTTARDSLGMQEIRQSGRTRTTKEPENHSEIRTNLPTTTSSTIVTKKQELIFDRKMTVATTKIPLRVLGQSTIKATEIKQGVSNSSLLPGTISPGDPNKSDSLSGKLTSRKLELQFSTPTKLLQPLSVSMKSKSAKQEDTRPKSSTVRSNSTSNWNSSTITRQPLTNIFNQSTNKSVSSATKSLSLTGVKFQTATTVSRESTLESRVPIITPHSTVRSPSPLTSSGLATNALSSMARSKLMNTSFHPTTKELVTTTDNRLENSTPTFMQLSTKEVPREEVTVGLHLHSSLTDNTWLADHDPESRVVKINSFRAETRSTTPIDRLIDIEGRSGKDIPFKEKQEGGKFVSSSQSLVWTLNTLSTNSNVRTSAKSSTTRITTLKPNPNSPSIQSLGQEKEMPLSASDTPIGYRPNVMNNPESNSGHAERQVASASVGSTKPRVWIPVIRAMDHSLTTLKPTQDTVLTNKAVVNTDDTKTPWWYRKIKH